MYCSVLGQDSLRIAKAKEDFSIFKNILKQGHPNLHAYISQDSLTTLFETTETEIDSTTSDLELYKKMLRITNAIKDGHLVLFPSNAMNVADEYFPLLLKIINTELYTDTDDYGIPVGAKITNINGVSTSVILEKLKKYAATDGYNLTKKHRDIELQFGIYYTYEYGITKQFSIQYIEPNGTAKHMDLDAESFTTIKYRNTKRNSYFAKYHNQENGMAFFEHYINPKMPFVYYKDKTAILVVHSFGIEVTAFKSRLITLFKAIKKSRAKHLIVDIRHNDGRSRPNAVALYSFLAKTPFKEIKSASVSSLSIPERSYATHVVLDEERFLKEKFYNHPQYDSWKLDFDDLEIFMVPRRDRFKGKIYVLAGGSTFAAGTTFAIHAKDDPEILLIGEETGGGYHTSTGNFPVYYEFPNTKIMMVLSMQKTDNYTQDTTAKIGSGVPPERYIPLSLQDLIAGRDAPLDYVLQLIKK